MLEDVIMRLSSNRVQRDETTLPMALARVIGNGHSGGAEKYGSANKALLGKNADRPRLKSPRRR